MVNFMTGKCKFIIIHKQTKHQSSKISILIFTKAFMINQYMWIKLKYPINKEIFLRPIQSTLCNKETFFTYYTAEEEFSTNTILAWKDFPFTRLKKWMVISSKLNKSQCLMKLILFLFQGRVDHFHFILISRLELSCWQPGNARSCLK